jgi:hypothetical protein
MKSPIPRLRADLERRAINHRRMTAVEVFHLSSALRGWHVTPRTAAGDDAIDARVWLAAALASRGRYRAPETDGHRAELRDGGRRIDSIVLMAIVQRHFLTAPAPAWDDAALAGQLGVERDDVVRAQRVLDAMQVFVRRAAPPLGARWWTRVPRARTT